MDNKLLNVTTLFYGKMVAKLTVKWFGGYAGWGDENRIPQRHLKESLLENVERGDWVDVANLAMMLDYRQTKKPRCNAHAKMFPV